MNSENAHTHSLFVSTIKGKSLDFPFFIYMHDDYSYGMILLRMRAGRWQTLLVHHANGHFWAFPKGHLEGSETPQEAAVREVKEEVNLTVTSFFSYPPLEESYHFSRGNHAVHKKVVYYLGRATGKIKVDGVEILEAKWLFLEEAVMRVTYPEAKHLCQQVMRIVLHSQAAPGE